MKGISPFHSPSVFDNGMNVNSTSPSSQIYIILSNSTRNSPNFSSGSVPNNDVVVNGGFPFINFLPVILVASILWILVYCALVTQRFLAEYKYIFINGKMDNLSDSEEEKSFFANV